MTTPFPPHGTSQCALLLARMIANLRNANAQPLNDAIIREFTGELISSNFKAATDECPARYFAKNRDQSILVIDGTTTMTQARRLFAGYGGTLGIPSLDPQNDYLNAAADIVANELIATGFSTTVQFFFGGWSLGGAIAHLVPMRLQVPGWRASDFHVASFGAPRSAGRSQTSAIQTFATNERWMTANDPIPLVPPRPLDFPGLPLIVGAGAAITFAAFTHCGGGRSMEINGEITPSILPTFAANNFLASLATWYLQWDQGQDPQHSIAQYITRLERSEAFYTHTQGRAINRAEAPANAPVHQVQRHEAVVAQAIINLERQQGMDPVDIAPQRRFIARRVGRVWMVFLGDSLISMPGSRRAARSLARHGNEFVLSLQNKAFVNPQGIIGGFQDYLALAATPDAGFRPVLQTTLPAAPV